MLRKGERELEGLWFARLVKVAVRAWRRVLRQLILSSSLSAHRVEASRDLSRRHSGSKIGAFSPHFQCGHVKCQLIVDFSSLTPFWIFRYIVPFLSQVIQY